MTAHDEDASHLSGHDAKGYADALRTIDQLIRGYARDFRNLVDMKARRTARRISADMHSLHFESDELRSILNRIVSGEINETDMDEISRLLERTAAEAYGVLSALSGTHRPSIEKTFGAVLWKQIDDRIREVKVHIRRQIRNLTRPKLTKQEKQKLARVLLKEIKRFNTDLATIRDTLAPPLRKLAPRAHARARASKAG